jgi:glycosyltransferase involved in cell wall biosynthesis
MEISIIIPTHNRLWSLPKAIDSCQSKRYKIEIIVVDDGSTDGTWEWLQKQPNIVAIRQSNWGKPWAVNRAFQVAKGKYIRFLDSDDWLCPNANEWQFEIAEAKQADLVVGGYEVYDEDENMTRKQEWIECDDFIAQQLGEVDSSHYSAFLFRREFIKEIPHRTSFASADFASRDDRCLMLEVALAKPNIAIHFEPTLCHRHHTHKRLQFAQSLRSTGTNLQHLLIYKNILSELVNKGELTLRRKRAACKILWSLAHWIAYTHLDEACEVVEWIYSLDPDFRLPVNGSLRSFYKNLGFRNTEKILYFRRIAMSIFRKKTQHKSYIFPI